MNWNIAATIIFTVVVMEFINILCVVYGKLSGKSTRRLVRGLERHCESRENCFKCDFGLFCGDNRYARELREQMQRKTTMCDLYVKDKTTGRVHKIGTDRYDSMWVNKGVVHYQNLKNGDGCGGDGDDERNGYVFMPSDCGELEQEDEEYND